MSYITQERDLVIEIIKQRCAPEDNRYLSRTSRYWHTLKALICLAVNRWANSCDLDSSVLVAIHRSGQYTDYELGTCYWWEGIKVGYGFRNWWVYPESDGAP